MKTNIEKMEVNENKENHATIEKEIRNIKEKSKINSFLIKNFYLFAIMMFTTLVAYCIRYYFFKEITDSTMFSGFLFWSASFGILFFWIYAGSSRFQQIFNFIVFSFMTGNLLYVFLKEKDINKFFINFIFIVSVVFIDFLFCNLNNFVRTLSLFIMNFVLSYINIKLLNLSGYFIVFRFFIVGILFVFITSIRDLIKNKENALKRLEEDKVKIIFLSYAISCFMLFM